VTPQRVKVPEFELAANPTIRIADVKRRFLFEFCPVCGCRVGNLRRHIVDMDDDVHAILEVMES